MLRLFRFHAWYGKGEIDAEGLRAAAEAKDKLKTLSAERIAKELLRLLEAGNPAPVLRVMAATGILSELLPGALQLPRLEKLAQMDADNLFAARRHAAAGGAAAGRRGWRACRGRCAETVQCRSHRLEQALGGEKSTRICRRGRRGGCSIGIGVARFRDKVLLQWAARRKAPARCNGACCWTWRTTGSGRAFRSPGAM